MIVDAHAHVIVPEITRDAAPGEAWRPRVYRDDGHQVVELGGRELRSAVGEFVDVEQILAAERELGIDGVLLCPWVGLLHYDAEPEEGLRRCRIQNDALGALARARPDRVAALGTIPLQDPALAARELEALIEAGALAGVEIAASVRGAALGDERFEPFWEAAARTGALVLIHPTTRGFDAPAFSDYYLWNLVGNPIETTLAAAHMALAGVMERHPTLRVLLAHGGGAIVALRGRLERGHSFQAQARARLRESVRDSLGRFHYDTVVYEPAVLRALVDAVGAERVLLGSDRPFDMADPDPVATVRALGLDERSEAAILGGNAARLTGSFERAQAAPA